MKVINLSLLLAALVRISFGVHRMAAPGNKYFIQEKLATPAAHHASFEALWETKWKPLVSIDFDNS